MRSSCRGFILWFLMAAIAAGNAWAIVPGTQLTPAGFPQNTSRYVLMRDGVEIALTIWLPADLRPGERIPALMRETRYWRGPKLGWGVRALAALHIIHWEDLADKQRVYFNARRFAVILMDARGSGASGGRRIVEYSPAEVADLGEVAAWISTQPWSSGRVGTFGTSYDGNAAELAAVSSEPAIRAVMPLYDDFDTQALVQPGGVPLQAIATEWSRVVAGLDRNDVCGASDVKGWDCWKIRQMIEGVRPVDADPHGKHLARLLQDRHNANPVDSVEKAEFRDDLLNTPEGAFSFKDISPYGLRKAIESSNVSMMVWCGWLDANPCEGALIRFRTFSNPQELIIGPLSHGGDFNVDPFATTHKPAVPSKQDQFKIEADFFEQTLRDESPAPIEPHIRYYTMGEGSWHTTTIWPPADLTAELFYFAEGNVLSQVAPNNRAAFDTYDVDFTATSGDRTRWHTQLGGGDVIYPDRDAADRKLLTYTSAPLDTDLEITGSPILTLAIASSRTDGAIHAYLEDVSPEGRVTYLDEGVFRMIDRKEVDAGTLPFEPLGPAHSFLRSDAEPMTPGTATTVRFSMLPTSLVMQKGHKIRVAIAGADANLFQRIPANGLATWTIYREDQRASSVELPGRRRPLALAH
jgi:putative CocE/NonD family hydrolase